VIAWLIEHWRTLAATIAGIIAALALASYLLSEAICWIARQSD